MTLSPVWSWIHRSATTPRSSPIWPAGGRSGAEHVGAVASSVATPRLLCRFAPAGVPKFWCHESGNHSPRYRMHGERIGCRSGPPALNQGVPRPAFETRHHVHRAGGAAMSGSSRAAAAIAGSGDAVACAGTMRAVAPTAVCATQIATRFMSHSRPRDGAGLPLAGTALMGSISSVWYDLRRCNGSFANRCWQSTAQVNRSRTVESASIGCNRPAGK
jgi:hypothetical protein